MESTSFSKFIKKDTNIFGPPNGSIYLEDRLVAKVNNDVISIVDENICPLRFFRNKSFSSWCKTRVIDTQRTNSRLLLKALNIKTNQDVDIVRHIYCSCVTDRYWFKEKDSSITFKESRAYQDRLADLSLFGKYTEWDGTLTPEISLIGSFEKCWRKVNDSWFLFKRGSLESNFSEMFASRLGKLLGLNIVDYKLLDDVVSCPDFTNNGLLTFEPMESLVGLDSNFESTIEILRDLQRTNLVTDNCDNLVNSYLDICFLDYIIFNQDRHTFNYGLLRDLNTGKVCGLAPNYDNNLSLISLEKFESRVVPNNWYNTLIPQLVKYRYSIPYIDENMLDFVLEEFKDLGIDLEYVKCFVLNNYLKLNKLIDEYRLNVED